MLAEDCDIRPYFLLSIIGEELRIRPGLRKEFTRLRVHAHVLPRSWQNFCSQAEGKRGAIYGHLLRGQSRVSDIEFASGHFMRNLVIRLLKYNRYTEKRTSINVKFNELSSDT